MATPQASLGFVGYVVFITNDSNIHVRATTCDLSLKQSIEKPPLVDSKYDKTVYQLGPRLVDGSIAFPAVHEDGVASIESLWRLAIERPGTRLQQFDVEVKYANLPSETVFLYTNTLVNTWEFNVTQGDVVNINVGLMGIDRETTNGRQITYSQRNSRIVTWNDVKVALISPEFEVNPGVIGSSIRSFTATINNNADRAYTLNGKLAPQDVFGTKRDIDGTITLMGRNTELGSLARSNEDRCNEESKIQFGYSLVGGNCVGNWYVELPGVVFEIEEIAITNELLETTVNWHALPGANYVPGVDENFEIDNITY